MAFDRPVTVLDNIIELLGEGGHDRKARWLSEQRAIIVDAASSESEKERVRTEIHGDVLVMGGLIDRGFVGPLASEQRRRLLELAEELYELTR